jgi:hypothetical protein
MQAILRAVEDRARLVRGVADGVDAVEGLAQVGIEGLGRRSGDIYAELGYKPRSSSA